MNVEVLIYRIVYRRRAVLIDPTTVLSVVTSRRRAPQGPIEAPPDAADRRHELRRSHGFPYNRCLAHD